MFFQEVTPDTSGYMIAGYVTTFLILGLYVLSMYLRNRNYRQDMALLEEMDQPAAAVKAGSSSSGKPKKKAAKPGTKKGRK